MSFPPLDLGQLQFRCAQSKHQLRVTSSVQTSSIKNIGIASQNLNLLDALTSREVWATRGDGLQIAFNLLMNGKHPDDTAQRTLQIEGLGTVLRNAELWEQLHLRPSLSLPTLSAEHHSSTPDIVLRLHHAESPRKVETVPKRRFAYSSTPIADVRPPFGVPSVGLESIEITLDFCPSQSPKVQPKKKRSKTEEVERWQGGCFSARDDENEDTLLLDTEYFSQPVFPTKSEEGPGFDELDHVREWASQPASSSDFISFLDDDSETLQPLPSDKLHSPEKPPLVQAEASHIHTLKRPAEEKLPTDDATEPIQLHNAVQLMDAAIRNLICNKPLRTAAGIKLLGDKSKPIAKLADLAPALWSPGYLPAIAQRAHFIPTIAQAMSSLSTRTRSSALREKLATIGAMATSPILQMTSRDSSAAERSSVGPQAISKVMKARLWRMMQQKMYDTGAARRLRPLKSVNTVESQAALGRGDTEEMLVEDMTEPQFACTQTDEDTLFESLTEDPGPASDMFLEELDGPLLSSNPSQERFERVLDDEEILLLDDEEILLDEYGDSDEEITLLGDEEFDWWHGFDGSIPANDDENINLIEQLVNPVWGDHQVSFTPHDGKGTEVSDDELLGFSDTEDDNLLRSQEELLEVLPINHAASSHQERMRI